MLRVEIQNACMGRQMDVLMILNEHSSISMCCCKALPLERSQQEVQALNQRCSILTTRITSGHGLYIPLNNSLSVTSLETKMEPCPHPFSPLRILGSWEENAAQMTFSYSNFCVEVKQHQHQTVLRCDAFHTKILGNTSTRSPSLPLPSMFPGIPKRRFPGTGRNGIPSFIPRWLTLESKK